MNLHFHDHAYTRLKQGGTLGLPTGEHKEIQRILWDAFSEEWITEITDATNPYRPSSSPALPTFAERMLGWLSRVRRDIAGWFRKPRSICYDGDVEFRERHELFYAQELDHWDNPYGPERLVNGLGEEVDTLGGRVNRDSLGQLI